MTTTLQLSSHVKAMLDWEEKDTDSGISIQYDQGINPQELDFTYGSGIQEINDAWYKEIVIDSGSSYTVDLLALPVTILGLTIYKSLTNLKVLIIENESASGYLTIGNSGISRGVDFMGPLMDVGYSGVYQMTSRSGISITGTSGVSGKNSFIIRNPNSQAVTCKVLALGVA